MFCKIIFLNEPELILFAHVLLFKSILSISHLFAHSLKVISFLDELELIYFHSRIAIDCT